MRRSRQLIYALALVIFSITHAVVATAQTQTQQRRLPKPTQTSSRIVAVEKYTDELDNYARLNPQARRFFTNTSEDQTGSWQEAAGEQELENKASAIVWMKNGKPVIALVSGRSPQSSQRLTYYFRENGTLAKLHSEYTNNTNHMQSLRDRSYDPKAFLVRDFSYCTDMVTGQQKPCGDVEVVEKAFPLYLRSTELPFYALLKKP
ncbi:MAG TPA: hypothetical protein VF553_00060 [Pyrinomonadaceae bacterium]|jgi:hypothetical protein